MYDLVFAYRRHNVEDFRRAGAKRVALLMPWFISEKNHPVSVNEIKENRFLYDVVFIGHYENDHRLNYIKILSDNEFDLKLFGPDWDRVSRHPWLTKFLPINPVRGDDYNLALCSARIALCFFSKLNRDTYTRRCFEIPATGTFMLSEYSDDMANLFVEGKEADFFRSPEEMIIKIDKYINDDALRTSIAEAGLRRVHRDGHDVVSRMQLVLKHMSDSSV
jgi:spore maturation protein CgeB